ncbi:MAG TPA: hypothetical protein VJ864_00750 [Candidatus Binatia bacterium]|nr:hypothetical protein [Candidatus Binatia bacterium]
MSTAKGLEQAIDLICLSIMAGALDHCAQMADGGPLADSAKDWLNES